MEKVKDPFEIFSDLNRSNAESLTYLGYLEQEVHFCGHSFVLKTLRPEIKAVIALVLKEWRETIAEGQIWTNAQVAMALAAVDGDTNFCPDAGPDLTSNVRARLRYVTGAERGFYQPTLTFLYEQYFELENEAEEALERLQNLAQRSRQPLKPSPDSLTDEGTSPNETSSDIQISEPSS